MRDEINIVLRSLADNRLRFSLTVAMIAVGITSLVSIQTALDVVTDRVVGSFSKMGADAFTLQSKDGCPPLDYAQARLFASVFSFAEVVTVSAVVDPVAQVKSGGKSTDPVVSLVAADESYLACKMATLDSGRNLTEEDVKYGARVAVLGDNVRRKLFGDDNGIGSAVTVSGKRYYVAGTVSRQGALFGTSLDDSVIVPASAGGGYEVTVIPSSGLEFMESVKEAKALMRAIRGLSPVEDTDFSIIRADSILTGLGALKSKLSLSALIIGLVTLLGAAVGLMNSELISVKRRTREIGIHRAVGAKSASICRQFLAEAVVIGQVGGIIGIMLGIALGNLVAVYLNGGYTVPWRWLTASVLICLAVSLLSGYLPAKRAAGLDPIQALRDD